MKYFKFAPSDLGHGLQNRVYVCPIVQVIYQLRGPRLHGLQRLPRLAKAGSSTLALLYTVSVSKNLLTDLFL